jgi:hypothetical protein
VGEVKHNAYFEPLPDYLKKGGPLVFVVSRRAPTENHDRIVEHIADGMNIQRLIPSQVAYSRTRTWFKPCDDGKTEQWWFMDEYDSAEAFEAMQKLVRSSFVGDRATDVAKRHQELLTLMVPGTELVPVLFSEVGPSRIEFEPYAARAKVIAREIESQADWHPVLPGGCEGTVPQRPSRPPTAAALRPSTSPQRSLLAQH